MAETRWGLYYQTPQDAPHGPNLGKLLAEDVDERLWRAYTVANAAARQALTGLGTSFWCHQQDDDSVWLWTGSAWKQFVEAGAGAGAALPYGQWSATAVQTFGTSGQEYPVAFGVEDVPLSGVTRSTKGVGHEFSVPAGVWLPAVTVRFASGAEGSRFIGLRKTDDTAQYGSDQNDGGPAAATRNICQPLVLSATTSIYVVAAQSSGGSLATQTTGSQSPTGYVRFSLTRLA